MHCLIFVLLASLLFPGSLDAQNLTAGCGGSPNSLDVVDLLRARFTSTDSVFTDYRQQNGLRALVPGEPEEPVTDESICRELGAFTEELLGTDPYWGNARWETSYARFGPYYLVYVEQKFPEGMVGAGWGILLFDVSTLTRIPLDYECNCFSPEP
jgi:hypothetical protein